MANTLLPVIPLGSKSTSCNSQFHPGINECNNDIYPSNKRNSHCKQIWWRLFQLDWRKRTHRYWQPRNSWWYNSEQPDIRDTPRWRCLSTRDGNKSENRSNRERSRGKRHYNQLYYYIIISLLTIGVPSYAEEGETNNTSNPVAAATGNVTNQAVQFQNNGAPSRQHYGAGVSCNGPTMTFSPFYMGNHVKPGIPMDPGDYTKNENWGGQINFMVPLDRSIMERCKSIAARQEEKMQLNYELVRIDNCAKLQQKGFMLRPGTRVYHLCNDVIPIAAYQKEVRQLQNNPLTKINYDRTNQTSPIRFHQEHSSKTTDN